jgi:hypothetical protein
VLFCVPSHHTQHKKVIPDGIEPPLSDLESEVLPLHHGTSAYDDNHNSCPRGAMEARRFPEPEVEGSTPSAGVYFFIS